MPTDHEMPDRWSTHERSRSEITAAIERARQVRTGQPPASGTGQLDELAQRRMARLAADDMRRRYERQPPEPPTTTAAC